MLLVIGAALLNCGWLSVLHPDAIVAVLAPNGTLALVAAGGYVVLGAIGRRHPEAVVFVVLVAADVATIWLGLAHSGLGYVAGGYMLLLPPLVALVIPWETRIHIAWLGIHSALALGYVATASGSGGEFILLLIVAAVASQAGHVASLRAQVTSFNQAERIRALNRQAKRDRARLDRLNEALGALAHTDELTVLGNRLALAAGLRVVRSRIERYGECYGLLILDIDRFKAINDSLGHLQGDAVLRSSGHVLKGTLRPGDTAYRYGGEEFVVLMRVGGETEARSAANRIRSAIQALQIPNAANTPYGVLTVSIGVAVIGSDWMDIDDEGWLGSADAALYEAKANGRNRSEIGVRPSVATRDSSRSPDEA